MACSIETMLDLEDMSIEELTGRLQASEGRGEPETDAGGCLLLTEEEWRAREKRDANSGAGGSGSSGGKGGKGHDRGRGSNRSGKGKAPAGTDAGGAKGGKGGDACHYCGIAGHWARDCRKKKREQANLVEAHGDDEEPAMLMVEHVSLSATDGPSDAVTGDTGEHVFLNEERARAVLRRSPEDVDPAWYLDTGASNHMTGDEAAFAELDKAVSGTVKFGDGSLVAIQGRGTVLFAVDGDEHRALTKVYWIPRLKSNIVSIGQLDEIGCPTLVEDGYMTVRDR
jgi:hypothetical protein